MTYKMNIDMEIDDDDDDDDDDAGCQNTLYNICIYIYINVSYNLYKNILTIIDVCSMGYWSWFID